MVNRTLSEERTTRRSPNTGIAINPDLINAIDSRRGPISRSEWIRLVSKKYLGLITENEEKYLSLSLNLNGLGEPEKSEI